ncbi:hypothetical protein VIGAN_06034400, partial [Vigna angularis var. angularis]
GKDPLAMVLAPSRELARHVEKEFNEVAPSVLYFMHRDEHQWFLNYFHLNGLDVIVKEFHYLNLMISSYAL